MKFAAIIVEDTLELFHAHLFQSRKLRVIAPICEEGSEATDTCNSCNGHNPKMLYMGRKQLYYFFDLES